jgi:outer membrane protein TolC
MRRLALAPSCLLAGALALAAPGTAAAAPVSREDASRLGAERGPGVAVAAAPRAGLDEAARASGAILVHPPQLTVSAGRRYGSIGGGTELAVTALVDVPTRRVGEARGEVANVGLEVTQLDTKRARLDAAYRAGLAWARAAEARDVFALRKVSHEQAVALAGLSQRRVKSGVGSPAELALALGDVGASEAAVVEAEGMLTESLADLRVAIGVAADAPIDASGDLCSTDESPVDAAAVRRDAEAKNPALALADARSRAAARETRLTIASAAPVIGVGASFLRDGFGDTVWAGVLVVPLPIVDRGRFDAARARSQADVASSSIDLVRTELGREVELALHDREHARELRDVLERRSLPPMREALRVARAQVEAGMSDATLALLSRSRLAQVEEARTRACGDVQRADLRVRRVVGRLP